MAITHTFAGSRTNGYGYYAFIEDEELVIGEDWPHEGGEVYRGAFNNATRAMRTLEREAVRLYNSITKYYAQHPEKAGSNILEHLLPGAKFKKAEDSAEYMLIDFDVSKCFVYGDKMQGFVAAINLCNYKMYLFNKQTKVEILN